MNPYQPPKTINKKKQYIPTFIELVIFVLCFMCSCCSAILAGLYIHEWICIVMSLVAILFYLASLIWISIIEQAIEKDLENKRNKSPRENFP